jgi:hypothetical protein
MVRQGTLQPVLTDREYGRRRATSDAGVWREKAAALREHAKKAAEGDKERVLLMLAEDCDRLAAELEDGRRWRET